MSDTFAITVAFLVLTTIVAAFVRRRARDRCLMSFSGDAVVLETAEKVISGRLTVENTGLEFVYPTVRITSKGHQEATYLLYKFEYANIHALVRYHAHLSEEAKTAREKELRDTYHPTMFRRLKRKTSNALKTVRDSVLEVIDGMLSAAKKATPAGAVLTAQDKYVSRMKQDLASSVGTSFEPLVEKYIGRWVVIDVIRGEEVLQYSGVLKDYTAEFIEILDVDYRTTDDQSNQQAVVVVSRKYGVVRHLGE